MAPHSRRRKFLILGCLRNEDMEFDSIEQYAATPYQEQPIARDENLGLAVVRLTLISLMHFIEHGTEKILDVANSGYYEMEGGNFACAFCTYEEKASNLFENGIRLSNKRHKEDSPACSLSSNRATEAGDRIDVAMCFDYKRESHRVVSFLQYALPWVSTVHFDELAASGFYYMGPEDNVVCFFCRVQIKGWEEGDTADQEHKRWSPDCPMVTKTPDLCNVPLSEEFKYSEEAEKCLESILKCERARVNMSIASEEERISLLGASKYPEKRNLEERLKTFIAMPPSVRQTPESFALAGFFSVNDGDKVLCFHCGLGLNDFAPIDEPFEEHAKWSPTCGFVILEKGIEFVKGALRDTLHPMVNK